MIHSISDLTVCKPSDFGEDNIVLLTFTLGFPSKKHKDLIGGVFTEQNLHDYDQTLSFVDCGAAICVHPAATSSESCTRIIAT